MKFKYYDLLSHLIPGMVILLTVKFFYKDTLPEISAIPLLAIAFVLGYFTNTISSWLEGIYFFITGGNPTSKFFDKKGIWKVRYYNGNKIKNKLLAKLECSDLSNLELFGEAMRIANATDSSRLDDFNSIYAFSRSILTAVLISGGILIYSNPKVLTVYIIVFILFIIALIRFRQRSGYYIREVLNIAENTIDNSENKE